MMRLNKHYKDGKLDPNGKFALVAKHLKNVVTLEQGAYVRDMMKYNHRMGLKDDPEKDAFKYADYLCRVIHGCDLETYLATMRDKHILEGSATKQCKMDCKNICNNCGYCRNYKDEEKRPCENDGECVPCGTFEGEEENPEKVITLCISDNESECEDCGDCDEEEVECGEGTDDAFVSVVKPERKEVNVKIEKETKYCILDNDNLCHRCDECIDEEVEEIIECCSDNTKKKENKNA